MLRRVALAYVLCRLAAAQLQIDSTQAAELLRAVDLPANQALRCEITPVAPALTFSFRFQAGYLARVPLQQFHGPGHRISVLLRVTPDAGDRRPVYLLRRFDLPDVPDTEFVANLAGGFLVGEGHYQSNAILFDDLHRVCRSDWQIHVKTLPARLELRLLIPPERVAPLSATGLTIQPPVSGLPSHRTTIFLHAAPIDPRTFELPAGDVVMAVGSLAALLERLPPDSVRLVVFNLHRQKELYRNDAFTSRDLDRVTEVLDAAQLEQAQVDYRELRKPNQERELLRQLIHREVTEADPSNDIVFLGPDGRYDKRDAAVSEATGPGQHFFYLQYRLSSHWADGTQSRPVAFENDPRPAAPCQAGGIYGCSDAAASSAPQPARPFRYMSTSSDPDAISTVVRKLKGKVLLIRNAADFAEAVDKIELPWRQSAP